MDEIEKLNQFTLNNYKPEIVLLEPPKENIWKAIEEDTLEKAREIKKYEINDKKQDTTSSGSSYSYYSSGSSGSYRYSYYSGTIEDAVDKEFKDIKDWAYKSLEQESKNVNKKTKHNPQLDIFKKKNKYNLKELFPEGSWQRKALLIAGIIAAKGAASMLLDMKEKNKKGD